MNNPLVHELLKEFGGIEKNDLLEMTNDNIADISWSTPGNTS